MSAQQNNSNNSTSSTLDLIVIGGGINGAGIAADAAGRGLNVIYTKQMTLLLLLHLQVQN